MADGQESELLRAVERVLRRRDLRSADRANMRRLLSRSRKGDGLTRVEREQLWAYVGYYDRGVTAG